MSQQAASYRPGTPATVSFFHSLRWRLLATGLVIWGLCVVVLVAGANWIQGNVLRTQTLDQLAALAGAHAAHIETILSLITRQIEAVAATDEVQDVAAGRRADVSADWLRTRVIYPVLPVERMTILNRAGLVVLDTDATGAPWPPTGVPLTEIRRTMHLTPALEVGEPPVFEVVVPIVETAAQQRLGWLRARLRISGLNHILMAAADGQSAELYLVGPNQQILSPLRFLAPAAGPPSGDWRVPPVRSAIPAAAAAGEFRDYRQVPTLMAVAAIPSIEWRLVAKVDRTEVLASMRQLGRSTLTLVALAALAGAAAALTLSDRLVRPLGVLSQAAGHIAAGRWHVRVPVNRRDELGAVGQAFNHMADAVAAAMAGERAEKAFNVQLLESLPLGLLALSERLQVLAANWAARRLLDQAEGQLVGQPLAALLPMAEVLDQVRTALSGDEPPQLVVVCPGGNGGDKHLRITVTGVRPGAGTAAGACRLLVLIKDVTAEVRLRAAAAASEQRFHDLVQGLDAIVWEADADTGTAAFVSQRAEEILGYPVDELRRLGFWASLLHPADRARTAAMLRAAATAGQNQEFECRVRAADGRWVWLRTTVRAVRDAMGRPRQVRGIMLDVTARKAAEEALQESEAKFAGILDIAPDAVIAVNQDQRIVLFNATAEQVFGYAAHEVLGQPLDILIPEGLQRVHRAHVADFGASAQGKRLMGEHRDHCTLGRRKNGTTFPVESSISRLSLDSGRIYIAVVRDITGRKQAEAALQQSEERFRNAFANAPIGMALLGVDGAWLQVNSSLCAMLGATEAELLGRHLHDSLHPEDQARYEEEMRRLCAGDMRSFQMEQRHCQPDGHQVHVQLSVSAVYGPNQEPVYCIAQLQDITERKRSEAQLTHLASHDPLTNLLNRRRFQAELERELARARRHGRAGAVLFLDLDHFKDVNDTFGHHAGDLFLQSVAARLLERLRKVDVLARLGGDEFAVLLPETGADQAAAVAEQLLTALREHKVALGDHLVDTTASCGIALFPDHGATVEAVLTHADVAMYEAKRHGRKGYRLYSDRSGRDRRSVARQTWDRRIRAALEQDQFVLYAQPIISLDTRRVVRHELLLRLPDENGRFIPVQTILDSAARADLIREIDHWVVRQAMAWLAGKGGKGWSLGVNLSGQALEDRELPRMVQRHLLATGIDPGHLVLEINEAATIADLALARDFMLSLSDLGCRIAIDDFGSVATSFDYLAQLPVHFLKIDGAFIRNLLHDPVDQHLVQSMVQAARGLGARTVAEHVDNQETLRLLREYRVDYAQGYYIGRPVPLEQVPPCPLPAVRAATFT